VLAAVFYPDKKLKIEERPIIKPKRGEVLVKVQCCGVCMSDYLIYKGEIPLKKPVVLGHEFSGVVEEVGEGVERFEPGDRVVVNPNVTCGYCSYCVKGMTNLCENAISLGGVGREIFDGGFQEYTVVPQQNLGKLEAETSFEAGTFVEPLGCVIHGVEKVNVFPGESVLVVGAGPIGLLLTQYLKLKASSKIIVSEPSEYRREIAKRLGADVALDPRQVNVASAVERLCGKVDVAIEAVGKMETVKDALSAVKRGGRVLIFGVPPKEGTIPLKVFDVYFHEIAITGSYSLTQKTFYQALQLINGRRILTSELISHRFTLKDLPKAFQLQGAGIGLKKIIVLESQGREAV